MDLQKYAADIDNELDRINQERQQLLTMKASVENLMRIRAEPKTELTAPPQAAPPAATATKLHKPVRRRARRSQDGQVPMRRALLQVLQEAGGRAMRVEEVLTRALALGATTNSTNPANVLDRQLYGLRDRDNEPIEKSGKRTWRWAGPLDGELHGGDASRQGELIKQEGRL